MNVTEDLAQNVLSLPLYPELTLTQVARVVEVLSGDYIA
jgi:dTDP-4-amino-4,6-dideoxygalactose transaminase